MMSGKGVDPQPPWVVGADDENLVMTRRGQTALWLHQHPRNCSDPLHRFLVTDWWPSNSSSIGSRIQALVFLLGMAVKLDRILVLASPPFSTPAPTTNGTCENPDGGYSGKFRCYIFPITSTECYAEAMSALAHTKEAKEGKVGTAGKGEGVGDEDQRAILHMGGTFNMSHKLIRRLCPDLFCEKGHRLSNGRLMQKFSVLRWWHAQAARYLLRWPTRYLCDLENIMRQSNFGLEVATAVMEAHHRQSYLGVNGGENTIFKGQLEEKVWRSEVYLPRPIISVHLRGGATAHERSKWPLRAFVEQAEGIRQHNPNAQTIWLSTSLTSEVVTNETLLFPSWRFYFLSGLPASSSSAHAGSNAMSNDDMRRVVTLPRDPLGRSFADLLMAAQCDYVVGSVRGSRWDRLLSALRKTGGKRKRMSVSIERSGVQRTGLSISERR
eukprot:TRINITY_DN23617_c0_g1_i1.p1 TRINITY_DN23617_c0_g1~~TRINITY_DN23617_c0_g1_i1.p1  ORF type:complete len:439 (+),score=52.66 TRINITY_DN23617_c0_g1_i1:674-1990(+)